MSFAEQLFKAGLVPEKSYRLRIAEEQLDALQAGKPSAKCAVTCRDLDSCSSMTEFKQNAKEILEHDPSQIQNVIQKAHRFKNENDPAAKKFIWFFFELRDRMQPLSHGERGALLRKAFRRHGSTFEIE